ncbi:MAG: glycosyltransferase family 4 protein [Armatimonadota bacterium]
MSILFIADDFPPDVGGIQTYACELARATAQLGEEVAVVASRQEASQAVDGELPYPVVRVPTGGGYVAAAMNLAAGVEQARQILHEPPRCLVATKWSPEGPAAILAWRMLRCTMVLIGHGGEFCHTGGNIVKWLAQRVVLRRMDLFLANSEYTAELFRRAGAPRERIGIIYGGVRPERFECSADQVAAVRRELGVGDRPMLLTVSRLVERKGHETVLRALPRVLAEVPEALYVIVGDGPTAERLAEVAEELGVAGSVILAGHVEEARLPAVHCAADVFVMPSHPVRAELAEGLGLAFLDAAAAATPCVGTHFGGIPDAIVDGETGLLVEPQDEQALGASLVRLLSEPETALRMGEAGRERVRREFTWRRVAERFLAELSRIDSGGSR